MTLHRKLLKQKIFVSLLCPFAPHICEEIWESLGNKKMLSVSAWPVHDEAKAKDSVVEIAVQVCGKLKSTSTIPVDISKEDAFALAKADEKVAAALEGKQIVKEIYIPGKIVNIVAK